MFMINVIFLFTFIHDINSSLSGIFKKENLQLNIGSLSINTGTSDKESDIYVLANEDEENEMKGIDYVPDGTSLGKEIVKKTVSLPPSEKGMIKEEAKAEDDGIKSKGWLKAKTWTERREKWKENNNKENIDNKSTAFAETIETAEVENIL